MDRNRGRDRDSDKDRNMSTEVDRCAPTLCHMLYSPNDGDGDGVALHHTKRTYMCTCITLSTLYGLQTLDPIEVH